MLELVFIWRQGLRKLVTEFFKIVLPVIEATMTEKICPCTLGGGGSISLCSIIILRGHPSQLFSA